MLKTNIVDLELQNWTIEQRRHFHMYPELSGQEYKTAEYVIERLKEFGLSPDMHFSAPNVVARFQGTEGKRTIALRADMDALPLQEDEDKPCVSTIPGVMHGCGHDGHTAILLAAAKWMTANAKMIKNNIVFIFQSSEEESPSGAKKLVEEGVLNGVDAIYGIHLMSDVPLGKIGFAEGFSMASSDDFDIIIEGVGGHGGQPQDAIDPVYISTHLIQAFQSVVSRSLHPLQAGVISIGGMQAGHSYNVIPHEVTIQGTIRAMTFDAAQMMYEKTEQLTKSICASFGAIGHYQYTPGTPPVYNHPEACEVAKKVIIETFGEDAFTELQPSMGAEDFGFYVKEKIGAFINVGMKSEISQYPHHHPKFDIDEAALPAGIKLMIQFALKG